MWNERFGILRVGALALASLSIVACAAEPAPSTDSAQQAVITAPLPSNLDLVLNAKTTVTVGPSTNVSGDVGSSGPRGSVLFDVGAFQGFGGNVLASTVTINTQAQVGHVFGNTITVNGFATQQTLGFDAARMPQVPAVTAAAPGTASLSVPAHQARQLCPGQFGAISVGAGATLSLNGGVYQVSRLSLADSALLEATEPVVILVAGGIAIGNGTAIVPSAQALGPMTAADIRIEVGGAITMGTNNQIHAHVLVTGKLAAGDRLLLRGAAWANAIQIGSDSVVLGEGALAAHAPAVPPPCNDHNACTVDTCVGTGSAPAFCSNTPAPTGTSCSDGNQCNGVERCDGTGQCRQGELAPPGSPCPDGDLCDGDETCSNVGTCQPGTPPAVNDNNPCTADACDAEDGVVHVALPDGSTCNGVGVCTAGTCSVDGGPSSGSFDYSASNTFSATQNTVNFDIQILTGQFLSLGTCTVEGASGIGDTFLRLFDPNGFEVANNDDFCGGLSFLQFFAATSGTYHLHAGCFSTNACSGTVAFTLTGP